MLLNPRFLAVVPDLVAEAREYLPGASIEVLSNGVDVNRYRPVSPARKQVLRARLGWTGSVFLYTGRFSWEKRLPWFSKIWNEAARDREACLILVGEGPATIPTGRTHPRPAPRGRHGGTLRRSRRIRPPLAVRGPVKLAARGDGVRLTVIASAVGGVRRRSRTASLVSCSRVTMLRRRRPACAACSTYWIWPRN